MPPMLHLLPCNDTFEVTYTWEMFAGGQILKMAPPVHWGDEMIPLSTPHWNTLHLVQNPINPPAPGSDAIKMSEFGLEGNPSW